MKNLLTFLAVILCSVGAFGQGAQYRPTPYANGFVQTVTSTGTAQTYLGIGSSTNNALLNGTNVFTGTNTFNTNLIFGSSTLQTQLDSKPTVALTNVARLDQSQTWTGTPTFPAAVFSANNVTFRTLYSAPTNLFFATINTNATSATYTNAGDFQNCTSLLAVSMPPLLGSNSLVFVIFGTETTNANSSTCVLTAYAGSTTNFIGDHLVAFRGTAAGSTYSSFNGPGFWLFANQSSFINQIGNRAAFTTKVPPEHLFGQWAICNTSTNWTLYLGLTTTASHTNLHVTTLSVLELVKN